MLGAKTGAFDSCDRPGAERMCGWAALGLAPLPVLIAREPQGCGALVHED